MKGSSLGIITVAAVLLGGIRLQAQYKGSRDYFPKNRPVPGVNGAQRTAPGAGANNANRPANPQQPAKPPQPKFKDVPVNSQFYFLADTNRTYSWTKISATTATNSVNGVVQLINSETPIQK